VLDQAGNVPFPIAVCLVGSPADAELDARLTAVGRRGAPAWLIIRAPDGEPDMAAWQAALHGLLDRHGSSLAILEVSVDRQPARVASFALQVAATEARANRDAIRIAIGGPAMADRARREAVYRPELGPYVDLLDLPDAGTDAVAAWLQQVDPGASIIVSSAGGSTGQPSAVPGDMVQSVLDKLGHYGHVAGVACGQARRHCALARAELITARSPASMPRPPCAVGRRDRRDPASASSSPVRQPDLRHLPRLPR
jgi:hypothetical protein